MINLIPPPIPAFPTSHQEPCDYNGHNNSQKTVIDQGMLLRDYFAAKAMQGMLAACTGWSEAQQERLAKCSYAMADAMLKAREA